MKQLNIYYVKTNFLKIIDAARDGEVFIVVKSGVPVAKISPLNRHKRKKFMFGAMKNKVKVSKDFDAPLSEDIIALFEKGRK